MRRRRRAARARGDAESGLLAFTVLVVLVALLRLLARAAGG